ncbi:cytochrome C biosynthesis protein [Reichenbachiella carrageenanivorans]|uniref:Cytochrome C biosynthesis protein n=1 Tax=Reichenbachiella carrageenanivorans TaxID=2979869 RepID=A0ABY6D610_9BACT|nr:cytochrome C biosynthesis protein [Reichenbachiella carrageenanivorans]UXX80503.1 cytochrome C biosynthesis protein [Reichenbachiella carrageenanivorans]
MTKKRKSTENHDHDLFENPEAIAEQLSRTEQFIEKNKTIVSVLAGIILVAIVGYMFSSYYIKGQNDNAQRDMFQAVYYFEADSLGKALNGDGNNYGFLEIISEYGMTDAANMANYYAGATYLKLGDFENAVRYLSDFSASDYVIQARAYALIGDAQMELGKFGEAAANYEKAADYNANKQFSPTYLVKAAIANEQAGDLSAAKDNYQAIVDDFYGVVEYQESVKQIARLKGLTN